MNFILDCVNGITTIEEVDNYVDEWHESDSKLLLYEYLGMTDEEYISWLTEPNTLIEIINERKQLL